MKKSQLRNIIRKVIKEQEIGKKPKQPMVPDCHLTLNIKICDPGNTGFSCGFGFNIGGAHSGNVCFKCNGAMCTNADIGQTFDNQPGSTTPPSGPIGSAVGLTFQLLGFSNPTNSQTSAGVVNIPYSQTPCAPCPGSGPCNPNNFTNALPAGIAADGGQNIGCRACGLGQFSSLTSPLIPSNPTLQNTPSSNPNFATYGDVCTYLSTNNCC